MDLFDELEYKLLEDRNFLNRKVNEIVENKCLVSNGHDCGEEFLEQVYDNLSIFIEHWCEAQAKLKSGNLAKEAISDPKLQDSLQQSLKKYICSQTKEQQDKSLKALELFNQQSGNVLGKRKLRQQEEGKQALEEDASLESNKKRLKSESDQKLIESQNSKNKAPLSFLDRIDQEQQMNQNNDKDADDNFSSLIDDVIDAPISSKQQQEEMKRKREQEEKDSLDLIQKLIAQDEQMAKNLSLKYSLEDKGLANKANGKLVAVKTKINQAFRVKYFNLCILITYFLLSKYQVIQFVDSQKGSKNKQEEEKKYKRGNGYMKSEDEKSDDDGGERELSQEDKELIEIYGPKIRNIKWCFENDSEYKKFYPNGMGEKKKAFGKPIKDKNGVLADYGAEYDDEYGSEEEDYDPNLVYPGNVLFPFGGMNVNPAIRSKAGSKKKGGLKGAKGKSVINDIMG